jgi:hypothetical protein
MAKVSTSLISTPADELLGNPSDKGSQDKAVIDKYPRSSNSGVPEKQFQSYGNLPGKEATFNPRKDLFKTPVND